MEAVIKNTNLEIKINLQFEEIKLLRADLLQTRADLQRTFVYTFTLATIVATIISRFSNYDNSLMLCALLFVTAIIFFMLSLSYIGHMRHYLNIARYIEVKCKELDELLNTDELSLKLPEILNWEIWNRDFYKERSSKVVFAITWGVQPLFPLFFGILTSLAGFLIFDLDIKIALAIVWSNWILKSLIIVISIQVFSILFSMLKALLELNKDIKLAQKYLKYGKLKSKNIIIPTNQQLQNDKDEK